MSFMGMNAIPNYDRTAQNTGVPISSRDDVHGGEESAPAAQDPGLESTSRTRTTSLTEAGHDDPSREKATTPAEDTDTVDDADDAASEERRNSVVQELARRYTSHQSHTSVAGNPFFADDNSPLNPNSEHFNGRAWAKSIVDMVSSEGHAFRTSGVAFQNLNVFGFGQATDYQKDVFNIILSTAGVVRDWFGYGKRRIDILRSFDGVVRKGEMLVVLGPPGSGCSTFLKTIAGETNGLNVDEKSYFNYQGKSELKSFPCCG
jgi:ATP-binding cassette, subfamily G (WHITE), member 2, PDR